MRFALVLIASLLVACGQAPSRSHITEQAPQSRRSVSYANAAAHSPGGWMGEVGFYVHQDAPERIVNAALRAAESWNDSVGKSVIRYLGRSNAARGDNLYSSLDDNFTVLYYEANWSASTGKNELILATTIWENSPSNDEEIVKGDIILNAEKYILQDATLEPLEGGRSAEVVDTETVLVHEMGHLLGLNHWDVDEDSVMNTYTAIGVGETKRALGGIDGENIQAIYAH